MGDDGFSDHPKSVDFLSTCWGDHLQSSPPGGAHRPASPEAFGPPDSARQDAPGGCCAKPPRLESCSSPGPPGPPGGSAPQTPTPSAQAVFWAGILQAQMCVLDLEEELEKTEGLRAALRACVPPAPADLPAFSPSLAGPPASGLRPPVEEDPGEDSSGPAGQSPAWPGEGTPGSSPEWGAEEEGLFFDNPLFLDSPRSETSASGERFSWGLQDTWAGAGAGPKSPRAWAPPSPGARVPQELGCELALGGCTPAAGGHNSPPPPELTYRPHPLSWAKVGSSGEAPAAPPAQVQHEMSLGCILGPAPPAVPCEDDVRTWESGPIASAHAVQPRGSWDCPWPPHQALPSPEGGQTEQEPALPQGPLGSQDRGRPQEAATGILAPGPWGSPASSPESESRGPSPSPVSPQEGSPRPQHPEPGQMLEAPHPLVLEADGAEPSASEEEEAGDGAQSERSESPVRSEEAVAVQLDARSASTEGLPENTMPQAQGPGAGQSPAAGAGPASGVGTNQMAWDLASRLFHLDGFRKSEVAAYLQKNNDTSRAVAQEYLSFFQFGGQSLDRALRSFLQALVLSGESQERERVLHQFSRRFHHCNPGAFSSVDSVHTLTCAIMLLNTDLHGQNIGKSMSCQEFITNLNGLHDGGDFPKELLKALYWSIRSEKLEWAVDEGDTARPEKAKPSSPASKMSNPFLQLAQDPTVPTYKQGPLARKMHHDADGKKTPWGKRGWKMFHTVLRGMVLYFLKGEDPCPDGERLVGQMLDEPVGVHHSLATPAAHYTKKPHVFQLRTADWRLYLFQAPTAREMTSWIARINLAAATHSAPPFPAAVGSQRRFVRPILPVGPAQSSLEEQQRAHENSLDAASDDLLDLQRNLPQGRGRSRELEEHRLRKEHLEHEMARSPGLTTAVLQKTRYETYTQLLVARLHCPSDDLDLWEEQLGQEAGGAREPRPSLKKSHSSPSLHQDEAPTTAKVKRNISERRTYRKIIPRRSRNQL
ncbi:PH and SEC7 domain-containing protein 4 isoform X2 [Dasypus novemcinctus]|uniref:PH and SEC7 domain-containing protein 4 isoform X2 n=1 Tax=Dasypus novemcinctus TaxID=9361 RepID=UPI00265DD780|nr:PH and SEC7 domain-containing protein 4 isoform X2 [Dasypus novemcinctus]